MRKLLSVLLLTANCFAFNGTIRVQNETGKNEVRQRLMDELAHSGFHLASDSSDYILRVRSIERPSTIAMNGNSGVVLSRHRFVFELLRSNGEIVWSDTERSKHHPERSAVEKLAKAGI